MPRLNRLRIARARPNGGGSGLKLTLYPVPAPAGPFDNVIYGDATTYGPSTAGFYADPGNKLFFEMNNPFDAVSPNTAVNDLTVDFFDESQNGFRLLYNSTDASASKRGWNLFKIAAGSVGASNLTFGLAQGDPQAQTAAKKLTLVYNGLNRLDVLYDGASVGNFMGVSGGPNYYAVPAGLTRVRFNNRSGFGRTAISGVKYGIVATPIIVGTVSLSNDLYITFPISYTNLGAATDVPNLQMLRADGSTVGAKHQATLVSNLTPGAAVLASKVPFTATEYSTIPRFRVYEVLNGVETGVYVEGTVPTMPAAAIVPLTLGYNLQGPLYYNPVPFASDIGVISGASSIRDNVGPGIVLIPYSGINGTWTVETDVGYTLTPYNGAASNGINVTSTNAGTGVHHVTITRDNNPEINGEGGNARGFYANGPATKLTKFKMTRDDVTGDVYPDWLTNSAFGAGMRDLDICGANYTPMTGYLDVADWADNVSPILKAFAAKHALDPNYRIYHHVQPLTVTDAVVTRNAQRFRDIFPDDATAKAILELSNETWSTGFAALGRAGIEGAKQGFLNGGTAASRTTQYPIIKLNLPIPADEAGPAYANGQGASPALATGECVWMNILGSATKPLTNVSSYSLLRALRPVAAGSDIVVGADFELIANSGALADAALAYQGYRHDQTIEIYRSVLGNERYERQFLPGIYTQTGADPRIQNRRLNVVVGYATKNKIIGTSFYLHHDSATYLATSGLTPTILAQKWLDIIPADEQKLVDHITIMRTMGNYQFGLYEGGCHPMIYAASANLIGHYISTYSTLEKSTLLAAVEWEWVKALQRVGSGYCFYYTGVGGTWGLKRDWSTVNPQYRLQGHLAALNGQPRPAFA